MGNVVGWCRPAVFESVGYAVLNLLGAGSQLELFSQFVADSQATVAPGARRSHSRFVTIFLDNNR